MGPDGMPSMPSRACCGQEAPCLLRLASVFYAMGAMEGARTLVEEARCSVRWGDDLRRWRASAAWVTRPGK